MTTQRFRTTIASPPDREHLVAEILFDDAQIAEINRERGELCIEIYPTRSGQPWQFGFDEFLTVLADAARRLRER